MSSHQRLLSLPVELLVEVMHFIQQTDRPDIDIVQISHVCSTFRAIAISCPALWTFLYIHDTAKSLQLAKLSFSRSKGLKLSIDVYVSYGAPPGDLDPVLEFLQSTDPTPVRSFSVTIEPRHINSPESYGLELINTTCLEELELSYWSWRNMKGSVVLPSSPLLRHLTLTDVCPSPVEGRTFHSLTFLRVAMTDDSPWNVKDFYDTLRQCPNLEEFQFEGLGLDQDSAPMQPIPLPKLRRVTFAVHPEDMVTVLRHVDAPELCAISFEDPGCIWEAGMSREFASSTTNQHTAVRLLELQEGCLTFPLPNTAFVLPHIFPNLEIIVLHFDSHQLLSQTAEEAVEGGRTSLWDSLTNIVVVGEPKKPESGYSEMVNCLVAFASGRNKIVRKGGDAPSPLSIVFQLPFVWESVAWWSMDRLRRDVSRIQIGDTIVVGSLVGVGVGRIGEMSNLKTLPNLPVELLLEIMYRVRQASRRYTAIVRFSHVCSTFRSLAISCPAMWRFLYLNETFGSLQLAKLSLSRSQDSKLDIDIDIDDQVTPSDLDDILDVLRSTHPRPVQAFSVRIYIDPEQSPEAYGIELINPSYLEEFRFFHSREWRSLILPITLPTSPVLRRLTLGGVYLSPTEGFTFDALTFLHLDNTLDIPLSGEELCETLQQFPNLEEVQFEMTDLEDGTRQTVSLPKLRRVNFGVHPSPMSQILQDLDAPQLDTVTFVNLDTRCTDMTRQAAVSVTARHTSVRLLELQDRCLAFPIVNTAFLLPQVFPNLEVINVHYDARPLIRRTAMHAEKEAWTSLWDNLKNIVIVGKPRKPESGYTDMVDCLVAFASGRNKIVREDGRAPSPLSIIFQVPFAWEGVAKSSMALLRGEVARIQIGETVIVGALGEVGLQG